MLNGRKEIFLLQVIFFFSCMPFEPYLNNSLRDFEDKQKEVFLLNFLAETVSIYDIELSKIYQDVFTTSEAPNDMYYSRELGKIYLVCSLANTIEVYDEDTLENIGSIYVGKGRNPWTVIPISTTKAYIPNFVSSSISVVNLETEQILSEIVVGKSPTSGTYIDGKVFICSSGWDSSTMTFSEGSVSIFDIADNSLIKTVVVGTNPQNAIAFPERNEVHIICSGKNGGNDSDDGLVYVLNTEGSLLSIIETGGSPSQYAVCESSHLVYLAGLGGICAYNYNTKEVYNSSDNYILAAEDIENHLYSGLAVDEENEKMYVCDFTSDRFVILNLNTYEVITNIATSDGIGLPVWVIE